MNKKSIEYVGGDSTVHYNIESKTRGSSTSSNSSIPSGENITKYIIQMGDKTVTQNAPISSGRDARIYENPSMYYNTHTHIYIY